MKSPQKRRIKSIMCIPWSNKIPPASSLLDLHPPENGIILLLPYTPLRLTILPSLLDFIISSAVSIDS